MDTKDNETIPIESEFNNHETSDESIEIINKSQSVCNNDSSSKIASSRCKICKYNAVKKCNVLTCQKCGELIHFHCSLLPPYMLFLLSHPRAKKYTCEPCADVPSDFLENIIFDRLKSTARTTSEDQNQNGQQLM